MATPFRCSLLLLGLVSCGGRTPADPEDTGPANGGNTDSAGDTDSAGVDTADSGTPCVPSDEVCNGEDDDCDGEIDEEDADADGFSICEDCDDTDPFLNPDMPEACDGLDNDCSGSADEPWDDDGDGESECGLDCDDTDANNSGHLPEVCDGADNDCDGEVDEDFDLDGDGISTCEGDCDDEDAATWPGADEICDGVDNDCDPSTDEAADVDGDGQSICDGDCDDGDASSATGLTETCDGADNDCDGSVDEDPECFDCAEVSGYLVCTATLDQAEAAAACEAIGLQLVVLETYAESVTVGTAAATRTSDHFWISLSDRDTEDTWLWGDGSSLDYTDAWWGSEPNDSGGEDCVEANWQAVGRWNDIECSAEMPFVCEDLP